MPIDMDEAIGVEEDMNALIPLGFKHVQLFTVSYWSPELHQIHMHLISLRTLHKSNLSDH
jgi:hypothetical protein